MTEPERIKNIEEQINLAGLLPGVDLGSLPPDGRQSSSAPYSTYADSDMPVVSRPAPITR
jgi:hypothetical protein